MVPQHSPKVLIKRYDDRLYNTETYAYVSLDDLATILVSGRRIIVLEASTGDDITSDILDRLH